VSTAGPCAMVRRPTPSGPEGSSGKRLVHVPQCAWSELEGLFFIPNRKGPPWNMK